MSNAYSYVALIFIADSSHLLAEAKTAEKMYSCMREINHSVYTQSDTLNFAFSIMQPYLGFNTFFGYGFCNVSLLVVRKNSIDSIILTYFEITTCANLQD